MSKENLTNFVAFLTTNETLSNHVKQSTAGKTSADAAAAVSAMGKTEGFDFTADEALEFYKAGTSGAPVSEEELEAVAGGVAGPGTANPFATKLGPVDPIYTFDPAKGGFSNW